MKAIFDISGRSAYDDEIGLRYHFPSQYLAAVQRSIGDWVIYRETRADGGRMAYIGVAQVERVDADPALRGHYYARMTNFLEFDRPVPYRDSTGRFAERFLRELPNAAFAGRAMRGLSVRPVDGADFAAIVAAGLTETMAPENAIRLELDARNLDPATAALIAEPVSERRIEQMLVNKKIREAAFRGHVLDAYDKTCAVTGLRIVNGGGKAEAQAAHIWAVSDGGPDVVQNGIALSATAHWLFDRHLISLSEDLCLLVSHNKVPGELRQLFPAVGQTIRLPKDRRLHPRSEYVARHREKFGAGAPLF